MKQNSLLLLAGVLIALSQSCKEGNINNASSTSQSDSGTGGSMARFTIANNKLYTVDEQNLKIFDLSSAETPVLNKTMNVGFGVETIFPLGDTLFLGTSTGMHIYDISTPISPQKYSFYTHIRACDPVVSDGKYAYVTLSPPAS